jgi:hypothetical protein
MLPAPPSRARDLLELIFGYSFVVAIIWMPELPQRIFFPIALILTLTVVLLRRPTRDQLGLGRRSLLASLWILPVTIALCALSLAVAARLHTLHPLYKGDFKHIAGYVLWTIYQQFLLQDYFMERLLRLLSSPSAAVTLAGSLFAAAHVPGLALTAASLLWGMASCTLFRRYRSIWVLGLAQGILGLCFAVCVPEALHHHLRVGLGYLRYRSVQPVP